MYYLCNSVIHGKQYCLVIDFQNNSKSNYSQPNILFGDGSWGRLGAKFSNPAGCSNDCITMNFYSTCLNTIRPNDQSGWTTMRNYSGMTAVKEKFYSIRKEYLTNVP